jgi:hypothetical protein
LLTGYLKDVNAMCTVLQRMTNEKFSASRSFDAEDYYLLEYCAFVNDKFHRHQELFYCLKIQGLFDSLGEDYAAFINFSICTSTLRNIPDQLDLQSPKLKWCIL